MQRGPRPGRTTVFHDTMFHGLAWRIGRRPAVLDPLFIESDRTRPLTLVRNGSIVPQVTKPANNLVVSEAIRDKLAGIPGVEFLPVVFFRLFHYPFKAGDFSYESDPFWKHACEHAGADTDWFYFAQVDDSDLHDAIGNHYELLLHSPNALAEEDRESKELCLATAHALISPRLLRKYGMLAAPPSVLVNDEVLSVLQPFLDEDYFGRQTFEVEFPANVATPISIRVLSSST